MISSLLTRCRGESSWAYNYAALCKSVGRMVCAVGLCDVLEMTPARAGLTRHDHVLAELPRQNDTFCVSVVAYNNVGMRSALVSSDTPGTYDASRLTPTLNGERACSSSPTTPATPRAAHRPAPGP